ncbi:DUF2322 family protein [Ectothiorhodospiraceae bacterium 2226]|nr:DUF2322 family protein [Ectothiorhodospiraceae bacterium 2226]
MPTFCENLAQLPAVDRLERIELYGPDGHEPVGVIENVPGQAGSLAVYYKLALDFGGIGPQAAEKGLELFAEYADEARQSPGRHPNIDRLLRVIEDGTHLAVRARRKPEGAA